MRWLKRRPSVTYHCACSPTCEWTFRSNAGWDGYHGPDFTRPVGAES